MSPPTSPLLLPFLLLPLLPAASSSAAQPFLLPSSAAASTPAATIPAFPEQSDVASPCPLRLPPELFPAVARSCSAPSPSAAFRLRCCPALAAWLYSSYAAAALPLSLRASPPAADLPLLPDDSESCIASVHQSLRSRGLALPPLNDTCDAAYCFCGIRLRPFSCPRALSLALDRGRWTAADDASRRLQRDCARPGLAGCSRCLRGLQQIKSAAAANASAVGGIGRREGSGRERDCELLGLTWLLAANRTRYLPAATKVLRALMAAPDGKDPATCAARNGMPLAVDSAEIGGGATTSAAGGSAAAIAGALHVASVLLAALAV